MTKDNLMDALNDVAFDMVEDAEAATRQKRTKRWFPWAAAAAMFLCIVAAAVFSLNGKTNFPTESTASTAPTGNPGGLQPVRLALFKCAPSDDNTIILEKDVVTPARMQIRVKNLQGLSGTEASDIRAAELQFAEEKLEKYGANYSGFLYGWSEDAVVTMMYESCPCIPIENPDLVASIQVSITGDAYIGNMTPMKDSQTGEIIPGEYFADSADVKNASSSYYAGMPYRGYILSFQINSEIHSALLKDPTIPLSTIESTITSTITMKDGSKMVSVVDVTVDDSGEVYFTSRCETTE